MRIKILGLSLVLLLTLTLLGCENPLSKEKPEKIFADMFAKLSTVESVAFNSTISISEEGSNKTTNVKIEGQTDFSEPDQPAADISLDLTGQFDQEFRLKGQVKFVSQELYLKIEEFSDQETLAKLGVKQNEWYAASQELKEIMESFGYSNLDKNTKDQSGLSTEQKQRLKALISAADFVKVEEILPKEEVFGQECYHYRVSFSEAATEKFFNDLGEIIGNSSGFDLVAEYSAQITNKTYEIWISKDDYWLKRIAAMNVVSNDTIKTETNSSFILELKRFNEQFEITVPEKVAKLNLDQLPLIDSSKIVDGGDLNKDTDQDGLSDFVESIYETDPNNPDSDKDGFLDGEEVEHSFNPLGEGEFNPSLF